MQKTSAELNLGHLSAGPDFIAWSTQRMLMVSAALSVFLWALIILIAAKLIGA